MTAGAPLELTDEHRFSALAGAPRSRVRESAKRLAIPDLILCGSLLAVFIGWLLIYPYTAEGDSILHLLNAQETAINPAACLHAWARPVFKLLFVLAAPHGVIPSRCVMAVLSTVLIWQVISFARRVGFKKPWLAGLMLIWQPFVFALASDTMSELPFALGLLLAIRCWIDRRFVLACLIVGFLPAVRPEGFFVGLFWGFLVLGQRSIGPLHRRLLLMPVLALGLACWSLACKLITDDALWVIHIWNWPVFTYESYGRGSPFHYVICWGFYCGPVILGLFLLGMRPSMRRRGMGLLWITGGMIFVVHSILYWRGWFCSCGLVRILATIAPLTALVALEGWERGSELLKARLLRAGKFSRHRMKRFGLILGVIASFWVMLQYWQTPEHYDCFPIGRCAQFIRDHHLIAADTPFFCGNKIAIADLSLAPLRKGVMETPCDPPVVRRNFAALPIGAIGVWDNRQAPVWHGVTIDDLTSHGFSVLFDTHDRRFMLTFGWVDYHYVVLRKDGPFPATAPSASAGEHAEPN